MTKIEKGYHIIKLGWPKTSVLAYFTVDTYYDGRGKPFPTGLIYTNFKNRVNGIKLEFNYEN